jgi:hypothetical protein
MKFGRSPSLSEGCWREGETPQEPPLVHRVPWDINATVQRVYVCPYAQAWYRDVVEKVLQAFAPELVSRLEWSQMKGVPLY